MITTTWKIIFFLYIYFFECVKNIGHIKKYNFITLYNKLKQKHILMNDEFLELPEKQLFQFKIIRHYDDSIYTRLKL